MTSNSGEQQYFDKWYLNKDVHEDMRGFDIDEYSRVEFSGKSELSAKITPSNQAEMYKRYAVSVLCIKRLF